MKIEWLGHACFLLETGRGLKIVTDPYEPGSYGGALGYSDINLEADLVTVSHKHFDHGYTKAVKGAQIVDKPGTFKKEQVSIEGLRSFHDKTHGSQRGDNIIFIFNIDGLGVAHLGDLGHIPSDLEKLKNLDVVLIPVGGTFTIDSREASELIDLIKPRIVIPMHFKTEKLGFDIDGVSEFTRGKSNVKELNASFLEVEKASLPEQTQIVVLKPSR
jgi:L-ascorbate metabolism protein UlaG (beta-lactamase superfamily)